MKLFHILIVLLVIVSACSKAPKLNGEYICATENDPNWVLRFENDFMYSFPNGNTTIPPFLSLYFQQDRDKLILFAGSDIYTHTIDGNRRQFSISSSLYMPENTCSCR